MATAAAKEEAGVLATLRQTPLAARYLLGGVIINQTGAFVQTFLVLYLAHRGLPVERAGTAIAVYGFGAVFGLMMGGELTHRLGGRVTIAATMATSAVLVLAVPWLSDPSRFGYLLVVVAAAGASTQAYRPAAATMLSDLMPAEHRVMGFSMLLIALNIGATLGPALAALLILINWDLLYYTNGVTALLYALLALALLPADRPAGGTARQPSDASSRGREGGYRVLLRDSRFLVYLASMLLSAVIFVQFTTTLPLKLADDGHPPALYSATLMTSSGILLLCQLKITSYVRRWVAAVAGGVGTTGMALGLASYGLSTAPAAAIASTVLFVSGIMISAPTMWAHPAKAPAEVKSRYIGASQAIFGLGLAIGPVIGVLIWSQFHNGVWLFCGVVGLIAAGCAVAGLQEPHPAREDASSAPVVGAPDSQESPA
jgi:MFS family permease